MPEWGASTIGFMSLPHNTTLHIHDFNSKTFHFNVKHSLNAGKKWVQVIVCILYGLGVSLHMLCASAKLKLTSASQNGAVSVLSSQGLAWAAESVAELGSEPRQRNSESLHVQRTLHMYTHTWMHTNTLSLAVSTEVSVIVVQNPAPCARVDVICPCLS